MSIKKMVLGQTAEIAGPMKAFLISKPEIVSTMIKKSKRPLLVIGSNAINIKTNDGDLIDSAIRFSKTSNLTLVTTGKKIQEFRKRNFEKIYYMFLMNLGDRLRDPFWKGLDGNGSYDLVILIGFSYYLEWLLLSNLKNYAKKIRTISLDRCYHPNATWSIGNISEEEWKRAIEKIVETLIEGE